MKFCIGNSVYETQDIQQALSLILQYGKENLGLVFFDSDGLEISLDDILKGVFC